MWHIFSRRGALISRIQKFNGPAAGDHKECISPALRDQHDPATHAQSGAAARRSCRPRCLWPFCTEKALKGRKVVTFCQIRLNFIFWAGPGTGLCFLSKPQPAGRAQQSAKLRHGAVKLAAMAVLGKSRTTSKNGFIPGPLKPRFRGFYLAKSAHNLSQGRPTAPLVDLAQKIPHSQTPKFWSPGPTCCHCARR